MENVDANGKEELAVLQYIMLNLHELLDKASLEMENKPFHTTYGRGFVLENDSIWLGYGLMGECTEQVELQFHHLPERIEKSLETRKDLQAEIWGEDLLVGMPFAMEISSNLRDGLFSCEAIYVHRGDLMGSRIDSNDYSCVGRSIQAFKTPIEEKILLPGIIYNPPKNLFEEGDLLTARAAVKYDLENKIRAYKDC